jgi:hypothetical protein
MSGSEVTSALERYEDELRRIGAPVVLNLRPGISDVAIRELEERFGVELPDEARSVWRWHNGVESGSWGADRMLVPRRAFGDLESSLAFAREFVRVAAESNPASEYAHRVFVSLLIDNVGFMINITPGEPSLTYMNDPMSWSLADYPALPIADRIEWWTRAIQSGAWRIDERGEWILDFDRYPQGHNRNVL